MDGIMICHKCGRLPGLWKECGQKYLGCQGCRQKVPIGDSFLAAMDEWNDLQLDAEREEKKHEQDHPDR